MLEMCAKYFLAVKMSRYLLNEQGRNCLSNFSETFSNICLILLLTFCKLFFFRNKNKYKFFSSFYSNYRNKTVLYKSDT